MHAKFPILPARPATGLILLLAACALSVVPDTAAAADNLFGGSSPLTTFITFMTGIFAYMLVIVGVVITLGGLVLGSDMSGFARRAPLVVLAGAVLILSETLVSNLFGGTAGAEIPRDLLPLLWEDPILPDPTRVTNVLDPLPVTGSFPDEGGPQ